MSLWNFYVKRRSDGKPKYPYLCLLCVDLKWYSFSFIVRCVFSIRSNSSHFLFHWFCKRSFCAIITILIYWNCLLDTPLNWDSIDTNFRFLKQFQRYLMWLGKDQTRFFIFIQRGQSTSEMNLVIQQTKRFFARVVLFSSPFPTFVNGWVQGWLRSPIVQRLCVKLVNLRVFFRTKAQITETDLKMLQLATFHNLRTWCS